MPRRASDAPRRATWTLLRRAAPFPLAAAVLLTVSACTPTITVPAGDDAADPLCARVVLAVPGEVAGQEKVRASGQATAAWGEPRNAITLACGVEQPSPTSSDCQSISLDGSDEGTFDWITTQDDNGWTFVTYGRDPAVVVQVPAALGGSQPTAALIDVASAVSEVEATQQCR